MADKLITIGFPIIVPPAHFKVKYRLVDSPTWTTLPGQDNDPFLITGLVSGLYELSIAYITPNGVECDDFITQFFIPDIACECPSLDVVLQRCKKQNTLIIDSAMGNDICKMSVEYTFGSPSSAGSWSNIVEYETDGNISVEIPVQTPTVTNIKIMFLCCATNTWITCFDEAPSTIIDCVCEAAQVISSYSLTWDGVSPTAIIGFTVQNSTPQTLQMPLVIYQENVTPSNSMYQEISPLISGTNYSFIIPVVPTDSGVSFVIRTVSEVCGVVEVTVAPIG